jgi:hypothetical protein
MTAATLEPTRVSTLASVRVRMQTSLRGGAVDDPLERRAGDFTKRVLRMPDPASGLGLPDAAAAQLCAQQLEWVDSGTPLASFRERAEGLSAPRRGRGSRLPRRPRRCSRGGPSVRRADDRCRPPMGPLRPVERHHRPARVAQTDAYFPAGSAHREDPRSM